MQSQGHSVLDASPWLPRKKVDLRPNPQPKHAILLPTYKKMYSV